MRPVELYTITLGSSTWLINNSVDVVAGFTPTVVSRGDITNGEESLDVTIPASHAFPQTYRGSAPGKHAWVTIQWLDRDDDPASLRVIYKGVVKSVSFSKDGQEATLHLESVVATFDKETPEDTFSPQCQKFLYDSKCGVDRDKQVIGIYVYQHTDTVTVVSGNDITVSGLIDHGAGWALPGYVAFGTDDYRQILAQDGDTITLILPFTIDLTGETVTVYAGCDHSIGTCDSKFDNANNFRGCPYVPTKNIFQTGII